MDEWVEYEYWDCKSCGTKTIRGDNQICTNCGKPRDPDITFYSVTNAETTRDVNELKAAKAGADWVCPFCNSYNPALDYGKCPRCGATSTSGAKDYFEIEAIKHKKNATNVVSQPKPREQTRFNMMFDDTGWIPKPRLHLIIKAVLGLAIFTVLAFIVSGFISHNEKSLIVEYHWEKQINTGRAILVFKENWHNNVSNPHQINSSETKFRSWDRRVVGHHEEPYSDLESYVCGSTQSCSNSCSSNGNGRKTCSRSCSSSPKYCNRTVTKYHTITDYRNFPVYDTWVKYSEIEYKPQGYFAAMGSDDKLHWPEITLGSGFNNLQDKETSRNESYLIKYRNEKKELKELMVSEKNYLKNYEQKFVLLKCSWFLGCSLRK